MANDESPEFRAQTTLLRETLFCGDSKFAYLLNPNDAGFVETLKPLSAKTASTPPAPGRKPICAHANHVLYGIELANRALSGETGVYESADWDTAWKLESVTDDEWRNLVNRIEEQSNRLIQQFNQPREWNEVMLTGAFAIAAHTAYHLGAIRQMLLDLRQS